MLCGPTAGKECLNPLFHCLADRVWVLGIHVISQTCTADGVANACCRSRSPDGYWWQAATEHNLQVDF